VWREYAAIRFKLIALVPVATAIGIGLAGDDLTYGSAAVAVGALVAIVGIVMYDLRNSLFYDSAIHRAKALERELGLPKTNHVEPGAHGGLFGERPRAPITFLGMRAWHDRALNIVYSGAIASWVGVLAASIASEADQPSTERDRWLLAAVCAAIAFVGFFRAVARVGAQIDDIHQRMSPADG
jgi:hypothetical protein